MRRRESSIGAELLWLLFFLALFACITAIFLKYAVPHHFNDKIAIALAAIVAALAMIGLRARLGRRG